jgi:succinate dehydrogenase flavin-adding protein (antitoxin of CptAB toxin-antitoxin module)
LLEPGVADLDEPGIAALHRLLKTQDQVLYDWLMGKSIPQDPEIRSLVDKMRATGAAVGGDT